MDTSRYDKVTRVEKPWGYEIIWANTPLYAGKILHVNKGHRLSLQYHEYKDETMFVHKGKIVLEIEKDGEMTSEELTDGMSVRILPLHKHRVLALEDSDILEASTPHLGDVVRVQDDYQRL